MAASHQAAKLAAGSLQTPVSPNTGAQIAQYERKDPLESLSAATAALEEEEEEEKEKEEEEKAERPARAPVMQGRDMGWGWAQAGCSWRLVCDPSGEALAGKRAHYSDPP